MKLICSWCEKVLQEGSGPVSHGCCLDCKAKLLTQNVMLDWTADARAEIRSVQKEIIQQESVNTVIRAVGDALGDSPPVSKLQNKSTVKTFDRFLDWRDVQGIPEGYFAPNPFRKKL